MNDGIIDCINQDLPGKEKFTGIFMRAASEIFVAFQANK
jgi:hypothetical protein